jgi:hypothetical protein
VTCAVACAAMASAATANAFFTILFIVFSLTKVIGRL